MIIVMELVGSNGGRVMDNLAKLFGTDIPIKFRGKNIDTGEIGYLEFRTIEGAVMLLTENFYAVDPESLGQLCGYDRNGKEVYTREAFRCRKKRSTSKRAKLQRQKLFRRNNRPNSKTKKPHFD